MKVQQLFIAVQECVLYTTSGICFPFLPTVALSGHFDRFELPIYFIGIGIPMLDKGDIHIGTYTYSLVTDENSASAVANMNNNVYIYIFI